MENPTDPANRTHRRPNGAPGSGSGPPDGNFVDWARRVNSRWLVQDRLDETTRTWVDHLAATDPRRLQQGCRMAWRMVNEGGPCEDPKPRFYGGLFSVATTSEVQQFLSRHSFTSLTCPGLNPDEWERLRSAGSLPDALLEKAHRLRAELRALLP